jgi:hypothetical protein
VYAFINFLEEMSQVFVQPLAISVGTEQDSLHGSDRRAAGGAIIQNVIGYSVIQPDVQTLRRQPAQLQFFFALVCAAEESNVFLSQGQQVEPLIVAELGQQGPDLESFSHHYEFGREIPQQEVAENVGRPKKREGDGPIAFLLRGGRHRTQGLNQIVGRGSVNPRVLQTLFNVPDGITDVRAQLHRIGNREHCGDARRLGRR